VLPKCSTYSVWSLSGVLPLTAQESTFFADLPCADFSFRLFFILSVQFQQSTIINGQVLESQRTTFVKQLKLGKVTTLITPLLGKY